jgi:hypothetical protein
VVSFLSAFVSPSVPFLGFFLDLPLPVLAGCSCPCLTGPVAGISLNSSVGISSCHALNARVNSCSSCLILSDLHLAILCS